MNQRDFELLVQAVIEGDATAGEVASLEEELKVSPDRRRQYRQAFLIHQRLGMILEAAPSAGLPEADRSAPPLLRPLPAPGKIRRRILVVAAAAAALCILAVAPRFLNPITPVTSVTYTVGPHTEYTVTPSDHGTRDKDGRRRLEPGARVSIRQGSMRVSFGGGAEGILLGAAEFTVLGPRGIEMPRGAARFNVTPGGPGFEVVTPMVKVVNLGTTFGVVADGRSTPPEVHVFKGKVEAAARMGVQEQREIKAGEAVDISDEGQFSKVALDDGRFLKELPPDLPYVWFPFDTDSGGALVAKGTHPAVATMKAEPDPRGGTPAAGRIGQGFSMPGLATPVRTNWLGISGKAPRTIAMWIKVEPDSPWKLYRSLIAWGRQKVSSSTMSELLLATDKKPGSPTTLCFAFNQVFYKGVSNLADGQWHHVAVVFRGDEVRPDEKITTLYVDGKPEEVISEVSRVPFDGPSPENGEMATPVLIGSIAKPGFDNGFLGSMDELYIFEAALDDERVRQLATPPP